MAKKEDILVSLGILGIGAAAIYAISSKSSASTQIPPVPPGPPIPPGPGPSPPPSNIFSLQPVSPTSGQYFSIVLSGNVVPVRANVYNENPTSRTVYMGASVRKPDQSVMDLSIIPVMLDPYSHSLVSTDSIQFSLPTLGSYQMRMSLWDVVPSGNCESDGTCHRLADTQWYSFTLGL